MKRDTSAPRLLPALLMLLIGGQSAFAAGLPGGNVVSKNKPVMLTADQVDYDERSSTAIATGHVELVQGDTVLMADMITYNQTTDTVHAIGHVSVLEPSGDVLFSDDAVLTNNMQQGVIKQFSARLKDNSLFASREAHKINPKVTRLKDVIFSPCTVCQPVAGSAQAPLWQVEASKATIDENKQQVRYQNAIMDLYGIPIIYTPYFSHPTPDAPSQSGLLQPLYLHDSILGSIIKEPVFYTFAPNADITLTPWYMTGEHPLLEGEFRGMIQNGTLNVRGAIVDGYNRDNLGDVIPGDWVRGYLSAEGKMQLDKYWDVGIDAERASDITFLAFYHFSSVDMLTSRLYAERIEDRDYLSIESLAFQGLQIEDQPSVSPYILPQVNAHYETDPLAANSRLSFDANALVLERDEGDTDQRLSTTAAWKLPYITHDGQVYEFKTSLRGDAYHVNDQITDPTTDAMFNGDTGRLIPQAELDWRYPFINRFGEGKSIMISPVVEAAVSPDLHETSNIPNEDSQIAELSDINLFSPDRFTGLDQVESGPRGSYGMRGDVQFSDRRYIEWLFGQAYQQYDESPFPLTTVSNAHYSDYIGRVAFKYDAFDLSYSFRLNRETFEPTSNEVNLIYAQKPINFDITYLSLQNEPLFGDRKEVYGNVALEVAPHWTWQFGGREDLGSSEEQPINTSLPVSALNPLEPTAGTVGIGTAVVFHNECISVSTLANRSYISEQDVKPSTTFGVTVVLKNFGATQTAPSAVPGGADPGLTNMVTKDNSTPINTLGDAVNTSPAETALPPGNSDKSGSGD